RVFSCASCNDCMAASNDVVRWCNSGGTNGSTNGGTNGSTNGGTNGSTNGGTNGGTSGGTNGSTSGGTTGGPDVACPSVLLVLDRSGSMDATPSGTGSGPSKLEIAKAAIKNFATQHG